MLRKPSKLKKGDYFVLKQRFLDDTLFCVSSITNNAVGTPVYRVYRGGSWPEYCVVAATPEEIEAQRRLKTPAKGRDIKLDAADPQTDAELSRAAFESAYRKIYNVQKDLVFFKDQNRYKDAFAQDAWEMWQHRQPEISLIHSKIELIKSVISKRRQSYWSSSIEAANALYALEQEIDQVLKGDISNANNI